MGGQKERAGFGTGAPGWHLEIVLPQPCSIVSSMLFTRRPSSAYLLWHRGVEKEKSAVETLGSRTASQFSDIYGVMR